MYLLGTDWLVFGYFVPATLGWIVTGYGVAIASHQWGYTTFADTNDHSRNNPIVGYLVFGEGYQNNHHKYPNRSILSRRWFEIDTLGWIFKKYSQ
jgi:stearoyl-CoA desaturase (delta-9 desaturase)